ncbi:MAG: hypothetical protein HJJLKODD_02235 [Phycisphaerae bacterium]|nr:hypothetical protein [Phycisphaerae bacterium]
MLKKFRLIICGCALGLLLNGENLQAQEAVAGSSGSWQNAKGEAVAARRPGLWIQAALGGPEITQTQEEAEAPNRLQQLTIDTLNILFQGLNQLIPLLPQLLGGSDVPAGVNDVIITEIANNGTNTFIELYNPGAVRILLDNWALCIVNECTTENELAGRVLEGRQLVVLQLGGTLDGDIANGVVTIQVGATADDLGLYDFTGTTQRDPDDQTSIVDYLQWSTTTQSIGGLEDIAAAAGLWVRGTRIRSSLANRSFQLAENRLSAGGSANDYQILDFNADSLGSLQPATTTQPSTTEQ